MYSTKEIAYLFNIHTNTVRFYEKVKYISPVQRKENGYRIFSERHIRQINILKLIYLKEWPGKNLRRASNKVVEALPAWDIPYLTEVSAEYILSIKSEISKVNCALATLRNSTKSGKPGHAVLSYSETADELGITKDTLRNWERNHFFSSLRNSRNRKYINEKILGKLRIIYCLRLAGLSMSFVHLYINDPEQIEDIEIFSAGDHLLEFLNKTLEHANRIPDYLKN